MNILQNNMSGRPIMIPVQEGLNGDPWWKKGGDGCGYRF